MRLLVYISGHGYGHSTRVVALLEAVRRLAGPVEITLRTQVPAWLFEVALAPPYTHQVVQVDAGVVEADLLRQDLGATLTACRAFYGRLEAVLEAEVEAAAALAPDVVLFDIPPLAPAVAARLGVPSVGLGNFSWDYIYAAYADFDPAFGRLAAHCARLYATTDLLLQLPFAHAMVAFPDQVDLPLIARWPQHEPAATRAELGLAADDPRPVVLIVSRHAASGDAMLASLAASGRYRVLRFGAETRPPADGLWQLGPEWQPRFVDVLAACDAVVSKLGYGLVSECCTARTAILYPPRYDFAEYPLLVEGLAGRVPSRGLSEAEWLAGDLAGPLEALLAQPQVFAEERRDGPELGARALIEVVGG